jgi:hypothetical protein
MALLSFIAAYYYLLNRRSDKRRQQYRDEAEHDLRRRGFVPESMRNQYQVLTFASPGPSPYQQSYSQQYPPLPLGTPSEYPFPPFSSHQGINSQCQGPSSPMFLRLNSQSSQGTSVRENLQQYRTGRYSLSNSPPHSSRKSASKQMLDSPLNDPLAYGTYTPSLDDKERSKRSHRQSTKKPRKR